VTCFYLDFAAQKEQSATSVLGALLKQVVASFKPIPKEIMDTFRNYENVKSPWSMYRYQTRRLCEERMKDLRTRPYIPVTYVITVG